MFDREVPKDDIFGISRNSLVPIIHEVLNSPAGQRELRKLNQKTKLRVQIRSVILRQNADLDIFTVYRPEREGAQTYFDWLSTTKGEGYIVQVYVLVIKIPRSSSDGIHIQTAFPEDFARTFGNEIVRPS